MCEIFAIFLRDYCEIIARFMIFGDIYVIGLGQVSRTAFVGGKGERRWGQDEDK